MPDEQAPVYGRHADLAVVRGQAEALLAIPDKNMSHGIPFLARQMIQSLIDKSAFVLEDAKMEITPDDALVKQEPMMQFFAYAHLPDHLKAVSQHFHELARRIVLTMPRNPERAVALRKILEAKDAACRSAIYREPNE